MGTVWVYLPLVFILTRLSACLSTSCNISQHKDGLHVDCSRRQLTSLPSTWPDDVVWLDMSHNQLSVLTNMSHPHLAHLRHLDLSHNQLHQSLANYTFAPLQQLEWLSLHDNRLQSLQVDAMTGLGQLTFLDMSNNQLQLDYHTYPPGVFHPLTFLQELKLHGNDDRKIKTLRLDYNCKLMSFENTTLIGFQNSSLENLHVKCEHVTSLDTCAFCHLPQLKVLYFNRATVSVTSALKSLFGLQNRNMDVIDLSGNQNFQDMTIDRDSAEYLRSVCVSKVSIANTNVQRVISNSIFDIGSPLVKCLQEIDASRNRIWGAGLTSLESFDLSGNDCYNISESFLDQCTALRHLRMSSLHVNPEFFRTRAWRLFKNLELLQTLDLSLNNLIHVDPHMLRAQRHLKELNLAGNRLQSLSVDLESHQDLMLLDLSHNMLPTLLPNERQALDTLASTHNLSLRLRGNPLLCACSNLDFVRWLWSTAVQLDGDGSFASNYTCVTETGEVSNTHSVMAHYDTHWRRCVGQTMLGVASAAFLLQLLVLVIVYVVSRSWTHLRYVWKVMKRLRLPRREHFRRDAYVGYADADWEFACMTLPACLEERHGVRLLLRDREELPGSIRAESILQHIDDSWKVLLLVTRDFAMDEWLSGFTVIQAQRSITDTMPDRVIVVFMEDPARLPPMASLERLLRMVPERNVLHVHRDTPPHRAVWGTVAELIKGSETLN
ncbi:hypothetical protein BaRGS_00035086 [Batillaria attramentaria]|uniref:TIR domain-containing protein n=1 Tax=Batillaria attramentaria TaxID=370345 RepID=A0ABD0JFK9_9CAEN